MRHWVVVFAVSAVSTGAFAQPAVPPCGTTDARVRQAEDLAVWSAARQQQMMSKGAQPLGNPVVRDNVVVLTADDTSAPYRRPFDLEGRSLVFSRKDSQTFSRRNVELAYDDMTGAAPKVASGGVAAYTLPFAFPFFDTTVTGVSLSQGNAIVIGSAPPVPAEQFNDAELAEVKAAVIAPLWMTSAVITGSNVPTIMVKELADRVSISWSVDRSSLSYDVQTTLFVNGDIRFSYKRAKAVPLGAIVITSGNEPWRGDLTTIATATDALGDVTGSVSATLRPLLDINSFTVVRIAGSNLLEFRMEVSGERSQLASSESAIYSVFIGDPLLRQYVSFTMSGSGNDGYVLPVWGSISKSPAARMEGDTVIMDVLQDDLIGSLTNVSIRAYSQSGSSSQFADSISLTASIDPPSRAVRTHFHSMSADESWGPIEEAFTLAVLSPGGVWSEVRSAWDLADGQYDGVAIYQNFLTDIVLYAGAYSTGGNAAVSGIKLGASATPSPQRTPNLLHMNAVGYGWNATTDNAGQVILHEFGHRWLYSIGIMQNGSMSRVLNPASSHPAQYVHTPGAFRVLTSTDASVMGGSTWTDNANGTFTSPAFSNFAYSWLDLYLMGLADKSEVPPFYYISDSSPKLGDAYYPPAAQTFSGKRNDVIMQQVLDAMGERKPAYPETQRQFNVLFVLLATPDRAVSQDEVDSVANYRKLLEERFSRATAGRAAVTTSFTLPLPGGPRRRVTK